jgi:hypothetical protein
MPINPALLIAAPMLQDSFVDKNGTPMANGTVTCYHDDSRTTLKNWYYQTGTPGAYTYIALPNPLTLSAAGTITDINGVDTIPFFYPYLETDETIIDKYYITIVNQFDTNQITRANFPYNVTAMGAPTTVTSFKNLIVNNGFWRNIQPNTLNVLPNVGVNLTNATAVTVAPSQHDGFTAPDIIFSKSVTGSGDSVTFIPFPLSNQLLITNPNTNTPEYYLQHNCISPTTGETFKYYQFPIALHVNSLANVNYTVSIQAQNAGPVSSTASTIELRLLQYTGTGTTSPNPTVIQQTPLVLTPGWATYTLTDVFPPTAGLTLGAGADDGLFLQVWMPLNTACTINFTKLSLYLTTNAVPEYDFQTYDDVNAIISSSRTGDIRISLNFFGEITSFLSGAFGWVNANDGTIGTAASGATSRANADTWPLYNLLWNNVSQTWAPVTGGRGANPYADFSANKPIQLPLQLSRVIGEVGPGAGLTNWVLGQSTAATIAASPPDTPLGTAAVFYNVYYKL